MKYTNGTTTIENVGIDAIEFYYPRNYVEQADLEKYNNVSSGKYTIGLGQDQMGFCADNEDIVSISRTVTTKLLDTYKISTDSIGCLVVGTETLIDKSKSVKTGLMDLFGDNHDIEGVDIKNACYGGAQALLHAVDWIHVKYTAEKRYAIVVVADIAVYEEGPARCTGGAGAIAFLIKPNAAIPIERVFSCCYMANTWDFYKPSGRGDTEYPTVDGKVSLSSYVTALENCYLSFVSKVSRIAGTKVSLADFDGVFFHSPFTKIVQKGVAILNYIDNVGEKRESAVDVFNDREKMASALKAATETFNKKTDPNLIFNRRIGNMYTPSMFAQLLAFLTHDHSSSEEVRMLFFAYGSGCASTIFPARLDTSSPNFEIIQKTARDSLNRLEQRQKFSPEDFTKILSWRENLLKTTPAVPVAFSSSDVELFPNTWRLTDIDSMFRRSYELFAPQNGVLKNGH